MSANPRTKSTGPTMRQARMEGRSEPASAGTDSPGYGARRAAPATGPQSKATPQGGQAKGMAYCSTKSRAVVGPKSGPGPSGIGQSGRGAPIT